MDQSPQPAEVGRDGPAPLSLTVVVPAFDEEDTIAACLDHALAQRRPIDRIVVVDNNSTDRTLDIAREYASRHANITVVTEPRQGVLFARTTGFDVVTTDLIGRIDADTRLRPEWSSVAVAYLEGHPDWGAVSGLNMLYDAPFQKRAERRTRRRYPEPKNLDMLSGPNSIIRRVAWEAIRDEVSGRTDIHEDFEAAILLNRHGFPVMHVNDMLTDISPRRFGQPPWKAMDYYHALGRTYEFMGVTEEARRYRRMMPVIRLIVTFFLWPVYGGWDPVKGRWSPRAMFNTSDRVSPVTAGGRRGE